MCVPTAQAHTDCMCTLAQKGPERKPNGVVFLTLLEPWSHRVPKGVPKGSQGVSKGPKGAQKGTQVDPKGSQRVPKVTQRVPKGSKMSPKVTQGGPKDAPRVLKVSPKA